MMSVRTFLAIDYTLLKHTHVFLYEYLNSSYPAYTFHVSLYSPGCHSAIYLPDWSFRFSLFAGVDIFRGFEE